MKRERERERIACVDIEKERKTTLSSSNMAFLNQSRCDFFYFFKDSLAQSLQMPFQKERLILIIRRPVLFVLFVFLFSISVVEEE